MRDQGKLQSAGVQQTGSNSVSNSTTSNVLQNNTTKIPENDD